MTNTMSAPSNAARLTRRQFMLASAASGGLMIGFTLPFSSRDARAAGVEAPVTQWIRIGSDETVTILCGAAEMGQGAMSGLAQIVADELVVDWAKVKTEHSPADVRYAATYQTTGRGSLLTGGSRSINKYYLPLRQAGATARDLLVRAAAQTWGCTPAECTVQPGRVLRIGTTNVLTYGQLAGLAATLAPNWTAPKLPDSSLRLIGKSVPRTDIPAKVDGSAKYGIDVRVDGMLYAVVKHCPTLGGTLAATPPKPSGAIAIVNLGTAFAVVADSTWKAMRAARAVSASWTIPPAALANDSTLIMQQAQALMANGPAVIAESVGGDPAATLAQSARVLDATYSVPYLAHATLEPLNCTAFVEGPIGSPATRCTLWAPTQGQTSCVNTAATLLGLAPTAITVNTMFMGGGLGRKIEQDYIAQAIRVSDALRKPVKLTWPREQDFTNDQYRPMALSRVVAGLDQYGRVSAFWNRIVSPSIGYQRNSATVINTGIDSSAVEGSRAIPYALSPKQVEYARHTATIPVGYWRSVGHSFNSFVVESALDELILASGADPIQFRLALLTASPRATAVLNTVARMASWGTAVPSGRARGVAFAESFGTSVAEIVEVSATTGGLRVHRVWCAVDCGVAVNPDQVKAQMESGIVHGLAAALWGAITFTQGKPSVTNFSRYRMLRMSEMPRIDVEVIASTAPPTGAGEPGVPPLAPAIANAYARLATGRRIRTLPMFPAAATMGDD